MDFCVTWRSQHVNPRRYLYLLSHSAREQTEIPQSDGKIVNSIKLAILSRENITLDTLLEPKPTRIRLPHEPKYEAPID